MMDRKLWKKAGLEIAEQLKELERIATRNGIEHLSVYVHQGGITNAFYITDEDVHYSVDIGPGGVTELQEDHDTYCKITKDKKEGEVRRMREIATIMPDSEFEVFLVEFKELADFEDLKDERARKFKIIDTVLSLDKRKCFSVEQLQKIYALAK